ncbi:tryptophan-rich sensory protein [Candidatus Woesebacteria bacterium]|nr:tryptophan-rich sensory protein [Candidatus Woesebacteria bacterium]
MDFRPWYDALIKPPWTPEAGTISLIWTILYPIIAISFGFVFYKVFKKKIPKKVALPFIINLAANLAFTPIFFGLKNIPLATVDILIVWVTILWAMKVISKYYRWVALAQIPYLIWVSTATLLQLSIALLN